MSSLRDKAQSGVRWTSLSAATGAVIQFARLVILARLFLAPGDFGLAALAFLYIEIATLFLDAGFSQAIIHHQNATREEISSIYFASLLIGAVFFVVSLGGASVAAISFGEPRLTLVIQVLSLQFLVQPIGRQFEALLARDLKFNELSKIEIVSTLVMFAVSIAAGAAGLGVWTIVVGSLAGTVAKTTWLTLKGWSQYRPMLRLRLADFRPIMRFSLFQLADQVIGLLAQRTDQLLLGRLLGANALGLYNVAFRATALPVSRINPIVTRVAYPLFAQVQHDQARLRKGYVELCGLLAAVNAPLLIGFAAAAPLAVPIIFGARWTPAIPIFQWLSLLALVRTIGNPVGILLLSKGKTDHSFYVNAVLLVLNTLAVYFGVKMDGAVGAAAFFAILHIVLNVPEYFLLVRPWTGPCAGHYFTSILKPILWASLMAAAMVALSRISGPSASLRLVLEVVAGGGIYTAAILCFQPQVVRDLLAAMPGSAIVRRLSSSLESYVRWRNAVFALEAGR